MVNKPSALSAAPTDVDSAVDDQILEAGHYDDPSFESQVPWAVE